MFGNLQIKNKIKLSDANKQHHQELYNETLTNKKNEVDKHVKETISSRKKYKKKQSKKNNNNTNVISRIENELGKIKKCLLLTSSLF